MLIVTLRNSKAALYNELIISSLYIFKEFMSIRGRHRDISLRHTGSEAQRSYPSDICLKAPGSCIWPLTSTFC